MDIVASTIDCVQSRLVFFEIYENPSKSREILLSTSQSDILAKNFKFSKRNGNAISFFFWHFRTDWMIRIASFNTSIHYTGKLFSTTWNWKFIFITFLLTIHENLFLNISKILFLNKLETHLLTITESYPWTIFKTYLLTRPKNRLISLCNTYLITISKTYHLIISQILLSTVRQCYGFLKKFCKTWMVLEVLVISFQMQSWDIVFLNRRTLVPGVDDETRVTDKQW